MPLSISTDAKYNNFAPRNCVPSKFIHACMMYFVIIVSDNYCESEIYPKKTPDFNLFCGKLTTLFVRRTLERSRIHMSSVIQSPFWEHDWKCLFHFTETLELHVNQPT